jgi:hypothetical protein
MFRQLLAWAVGSFLIAIPVGKWLNWKFGGQ